MIAYEKADGSTQKLFQQVAKKVNKDVAEKVNLEVMFAKDADNGEQLHVLKKSSYDVFGYVDFTNLKRRAAGGPDAVAFIDFNDWEAASVGEREGMIDHLLTQIEIAKNKDGEIITDSAKRPKLKRRQYDLLLTGFKDVVERHGAAAPESRAFSVCKPAFAQLNLWDGENPSESVSLKKLKGKNAKDAE